MLITKPNVTPKIVIHESKEHGYPHCHVGIRGVKVYVFIDGISPESSMRTRDLEFIYSYYNEMCQKFREMDWDITACPNEYRSNLYKGKK